jgi:hypothetical protein
VQARRCCEVGKCGESSKLCKHVGAVRLANVEKAASCAST